MKAFCENSILTIDLEGRIDTSNSGKTEKQILKICEDKDKDHKDLILNADRLEYISSSGLRIILRLRKKYGNLKMINVSSEVYDILDMTGFTSMIDVEKQYRRFSVDGCELIGSGAKGKIYRLDPETIIKVYRNPDSLEEIHQERELARTAFIHGVPTAISYDVVKVGDGYGSIFELLNCSTLSEILSHDPSRLDECVNYAVELLKTVHEIEADTDSLPDMKQRFLRWVGRLEEYLPAEASHKLKELIQAVPDSTTLLHGDYQTNNVMLQDGEAILIDMDTLCYGDPIFELANMYCAFLGFAEVNPEESREFFGMPAELCKEFWEKSLTSYLGVEDPEELEKTEDKIRLLGYIRLMKRYLRPGRLDTEEGKAAMDYYKGRLLEFLDKVSDLNL